MCIRAWLLKNQHQWKKYHLHTHSKPQPLYKKDNPFKHKQIGWHTSWCVCKNTGRDISTVPLHYYFISISNPWAAVYLWLRVILLLGAFKGADFLFTHLVCVSNDIVSRGVGCRQTLHQPQDLCGVTTWKTHDEDKCDNNIKTRKSDGRYW